MITYYNYYYYIAIAYIMCTPIHIYDFLRSRVFPFANNVTFDVMLGLRELILI